MSRHQNLVGLDNSAYGLELIWQLKELDEDVEIIVLPVLRPFIMLASQREAMEPLISLPIHWKALNSFLLV